MKNYRIFFILSVITILEGYVMLVFFDIENILKKKLIAEYTKEEISKFFFTKERWEQLSYVLVPLLILMKTSIISSVLYIGTFFYSKVKVTFKQIFNAVVKAEFIFLLIPVIKIIWFYFFQTNYTLEDLQYFYPLSALNIVGYQGLEAWFIYPLQMLNLFEVAYWLVLAYFIGKLAITEKDKDKPMDLGFKIVMSSYGVALLLWVCVVMFFTLSYS